MSLWYNIKDQGDVDLSLDGEDIHICFKEDHNGGNYISVPVKFIKELLSKPNSDAKH